MMRNAIFGVVELSFLFYSVATHLSQGRTMKRYSRRSQKANMILIQRSGTIYLMMPRI
jgi:hypothetical protein